MNYKESIKRQISKTANNSKITLSGEINIMTIDIKNSIIMDDELFAKASACAQDLRLSYPFIKIDVMKELHELTIKLYAYNKVFVNVSLYESLQENLSKMVMNLLDTTGITVKININGQVKTWEQIDKFMIVNNKEGIYYKITETLPLNNVSIFTGKLMNNLVNTLNRALKY